MTPSQAPTQDDPVVKLARELLLFLLREPPLIYADGANQEAIMAPHLQWEFKFRQLLQSTDLTAMCRWILSHTPASAPSAEVAEIRQRHLDEEKYRQSLKGNWPPAQSHKDRATLLREIEHLQAGEMRWRAGRPTLTRSPDHE